MPGTHHDLAVRWFDEVWNKRRLAAMDELSTEQIQCHGFPDAESEIGLEAFKAAVRDFQSTFSDIHVNVDQTVSEGDTVAVRWTATMKHAGDGLGFPSTGEPVKLTGMSFMRIRDGRMTEGWNAFDITRVVSKLATISAKR